MRRDSLLRSSPFRLALAFSVLFITAFAVTGLAVFQFMRWELEDHQDRAIGEAYAVIANAYGDRDLIDLLETVAVNVRATQDQGRIFLLTSADGTVLGGNIPSVAFPDGWSDIMGDRLGLDDDLVYRVLSGPIGGNRLAVGVGRQEIDDVEEILTASFAWATAIVGLLAVSGGAWIARRAQARLDAVRDTMDAVSHGNLDARIPLLGGGDDIDLLSRGINRALARLAANVESMRQVSADIAHDLKTPLNRMRMIVDDALATLEAGSGVGVEDHLRAAAAEADRINETFAALLRIAQIESGSRKSRFGPVSLGDLLRSLSEVYLDVAADAGQRLVTDIEAAPGDGTADGTAGAILGDRELLTQMFANLIENAIRHCPAGTVIRVRLCLAQDGNARTVRAAVEDDGPGIPPAERDMVLRRLYRLEKSRTSPGSGLGLSLVKAVADLHDAELRMKDGLPGLRVIVAFRKRDADSGRHDRLEARPTRW